MMGFWREVFSDSAGRGSSRVVLNFVGVAIGSVIVLYQAFMGRLNGEIFALYILATGGVYGFGRWTDNRVEMERIKAQNPQSNDPQDVNLKAVGGVQIQGGQDA